jgi:hypothetical protein
MNKKSGVAGFIHKTPSDLNTILKSNKKILELWQKLTPLARNEWVCWVTIVKKPETRADHIKRLCIELQSGKRRPCCWPGCPHRKPDALKYFGK